MAAWDCGDSTYSSTSEAEPDSDQEDVNDDPNDPQKLLNTWIWELENLEMGLSNVGSGSKMPSAGEKLVCSTPRIDSYHFSMANLEDSQDVELDAILGELCALETQFNSEIMHRGHARSASAVTHFDSARTVSAIFGQNHGGSQQTPKYLGNGLPRPKFEIGGLHVDLDNEDVIKGSKGELGLRTDSPDNDSAFSDNVSMLSSESSASSGGGGVHRTDVSSHSISSKSSGMSLASSPTQLLDHISRRLQAIQLEVDKENSPPAEQAARIKAEKIKIALEKIKEASIKKLFIKAFSADNSAKSLLVDERMTVGHICRLLADKNHVPMDPKWALVEQIPELHMERVYEDHEWLVENLLLWTRDSCNRLLFLERNFKYDLFFSPEEYLLGSSYSECGVELDDDSKITLTEEFFGGPGVGVPEVEGALYLKSDGKKAWKKYFFVLRASGLYYSPKGKSKLSKDLVCLTTFEMNHVYIGLGWRKKYKAPTDFGFAIKHPQIQTKSSKYIRYLCAEDKRTLKQWVMGIRIAKYGRQLKDNYDNLMRDIEEEDLDTLANARSFSISSMAKTLAVSPDSSSTSPDSPPRISAPTSPHDPDIQSTCSSTSTLTPTPPGKQFGCIGRQDSIKSSSSSGCMSERSGTGTPTAEQIAFDADFPIGTIKRKPSMTPKIPLTSTTRSIAKQSGSNNPLPNADSVSLSSSGSSSSSGSTGSLGRSSAARMSLRRSQTDDRIHMNGLIRTLTRSGDRKRNILVPEKEVDSLPLPPPPPEMGAILENIDDSLPPPPPEAFKGSTTSLDSLPPPPPMAQNGESWPSMNSLNSLPEPPSPQTQSPTKPEQNYEKIYGHVMAKLNKRASRRRMSETDVCSPPPYLVELKQGCNGVSPPHTLRKSQVKKTSVDSSEIYGLRTSPSSSLSPINTLALIKSDRRTRMSPVSPTNDCPPPLPPHAPESDYYAPARRANSQSRPQPPRRSDATKLSGVHRSNSISSADFGNPGQPVPNTPEDFLRDLHRVMEKKWKVAQALSVDLAASPHEILGFRDPCYLPPANNVHFSPTDPQSSSSSQAAGRSKQKSPDYVDNRTFVISKKKLPPPPPKRSEKTQLSRRQ